MKSHSSKGRIAIVLLSLVLVGSLAGIAVVAVGLFGGSVRRPYVSPPPWEQGEPLTPQNTNGNPQLISVARAQQIEEWLRIHEMSPAAPAGYEQWTRTLSFDEDARLGDTNAADIPAGLIAAQTVRGDWVDDDTTSRISQSVSLRVQLFETRGARDQAIDTDHDKAGKASKAGKELAEPKIAGASHSRLSHNPDSCVQGGSTGQLDAVTGSAAVGEVTLVSTRLSCFPTDRIDQAVADVTSSLTKAVKDVTGLEGEPFPAQLFDRTDDYPVISSGYWDDQQIVVDPSLGAPGRRVLPDDVPSRGVEVVIDGRDTVVVMESFDGAQNFLRGELTSSHRTSTVEQPVDYADQQICREGEHYQQGTTCWTRLGRFVVISRSERGDSPKVEDQVDLLRQ